ncbi:T-complex protein 1 subunit delta [Wickerhamiella sorbophila]|uniref:T-complex protein 1 subunit delta n=1 Tax=Wickerhamiella sorbophila TaxID=45607 RepID=A0A2T0FGB9_9ASCO|nr:T-complex protein 1 subunit delta [Wickerhamiella sorbophila]PRT54038.1 T-complex protein 1 subunit delta [Wickerhamiella sorbophila]
MSAKVAPQVNNNKFQDKEKPTEVRKANILAARSVADAVRTSLGPKGMDKMVQTKTGEVIITNDGATILSHMAVMHPAARMLVNLSQAQDSEAGDGTTSVVVLAGALLGASERLLNRAIHPSIIAESFQRAAQRATEIMQKMSHPVDLADRKQLVQAATTSLNSKIVSQHSGKIAPMTVDAVLKVVDPLHPKSVDLQNIRIIKKLGGTIDDTTLIDGLVLRQNVVKSAGGPARVEKAKIALIQFQLSPPKPDLENHVIVNDYRQMDKILKEERQYLLNLCKTIKKHKCNVVLIQKSILRDAVNDMALHFMAKLGIMVVKDIERDEVEFICRTLGCNPIADIESFSEERLGSAELIQEVEQAEAKVLQITGIPTNAERAGTCSIVCRGSNQLILDETERSIHDALCVIRCLVKEQALIAGGGAPEIEVSMNLSKEADALGGVEAVCWQEYAQALEVIPTTLAENAGINSIEAVTELRNKHALGEVTTGISVRRGTADITVENVFQPLLVNTSAITLASETVKSILRIDDIQFSR